jgi:phosphoenolpyruvate-protein phosphotransferase
VTGALRGRAAAPGVAIGPAFLLRTEQRSADAAVADDPLAALDAALEQAERDLLELGAVMAERVGPEEAEIMASHAVIARDPELRALAAEGVAAGRSPSEAVTAAFDTFIALLADVGGEVFGERTADLTDVRDRVVDLLEGRSTAVVLPDGPVVLVAPELLPSHTAAFPPELLLGVVTETGSPTSHASILARAMGIPAVVGCGGATTTVAGGEPMAIDGGTGEVLVAPSEADLERLRGAAARLAEREVSLRALRDRAGATADGVRIELSANIGSPDDLAVAIEVGAEGAGLVRTELLFEGRRTAPAVDEQAELYRRILAAFPGHRVVFRTMDIGADKPLPFVRRGREENPSLGLRGLRLHLAERELLRTQLAAVLRAADGASGGGAGSGRPAVMFPMVAAPSELDEALGELGGVVAAEGADGAGLEVGVMVEVPSAALDAARLASRVSFLSVGTNDLVQYVFAADRLNHAVSATGEAADPVVLRLIASVAAQGEANGAWTGVCGEAAGDPGLALVLVGLGVRELSMSARSIPAVKDALRRFTLDECRDLAALATAPDAGTAELRRHLDGLLPA